MYTDEEFNRLLSSAAAGSGEAVRLLDIEAARVAGLAMERQILRTRLIGIAPPEWTHRQPAPPRLSIVA